MARNLHQQEVLSVATMAVQTKQDQLTLNGITVTVKRSKQGISVYESGKEIIHVSQ
jgi:type II secretory pathway, pseudopilin pulG